MKANIKIEKRAGRGSGCKREEAQKRNESINRNKANQQQQTSNIRKNTKRERKE